MSASRGRVPASASRQSRGSSGDNGVRTRVSGEHFSDYFENASDVIIINDRTGRIVAANRAAREIGGYTQADLERGVYLPQILPPAECEAALIVTQRALDGLPIPEVYEREAQLRDGRRRIMELRSNVLRRHGRPYALQTIARDITDKKESADFRASLLQISQALLTAPSVDEMGRVICEAAGRVLHLDGAYLWLRRGEELVGCAASGRAAAEFIGLRHPLQGSIIGRIYAASDVLVVNDFAQSPYSGGTALGDAFGVKAMLAVPLRRTQPAVGVLVFTDCVDPHRFNDALRERALIFGAQMTVAIESALAREREEEEGRVSAALLRVTRAIRESLEESEILPQIARSAREVLECDWAVVALRDSSGDRFRITTFEGWPADIAEELRLLQLEPGSIEVVAPLLCEQTIEIPEPRGPVELYARWTISSLRAIPMLRAGRVVGALCVGYRQRRGPFSARERRIADGIAAQAAVAVENARLVEDLRRANQLKSEFLGMMSHELRTPLSAVLGYADLMREETLGVVNAEQATALDRMLLNGRALLDLINMTLDVNRLEAGRGVLQLSDFTVADVLADLRDEFTMRAANESLELVWPDADDVPLLHTDRRKLKTVLRNLIDNAMKFTPPHGAVEINVAVPGERMVFSVRDTGIGIPPDARSAIFEMFRQLDNLPTNRSGVGLGLYLVRRYTEMLCGTVRVESVPGQGSVFIVDIPRTLQPD